MATSKKFSELPAASSVGNGDLFAIAHEDALAETGYVSQKLTAAQAGQKVNGDTEYPTSLPSFPENGQNPFAALEKLNADIDSLYPVNTASGSIANFTTSLAKPLVGLSSTIVAQQAGSGTPSPDNVRAISGWNSLNLTLTGKNLFSFEKAISDSANEDVYLTSDGYIRFITNNSRIKYNLKTTNTVTFTATVASEVSSRNIITFVAYYTDGTSSDIASVITTDTNDHIISGTTQIGKTIYQIQTAWTSQRVAYLKQAQLEIGNTATAYEEYNGETKTIALGQTVYGGYIDKRTGKLVITHEKIDLGNLDWSKSSQGNKYYATLNKPFKYVNNLNIVCEIFESDGYGNSDMGYYPSDNNKFRYYWSTSGQKYYEIYVHAEDYSTLNDFKNAVSGYELVYELATPIEITGLIGDNFTTFAGENNIFSDCGDISVSFKQGIQEYIDAKIAETQALIL